MRSRIAEALKTLITLKGFSGLRGFTGISGSVYAQTDAQVHELYGLRQR